MLTAMQAQTIRFDNGNHAQMVAATGDTDPEDLLRELKLDQPEALILIAGGADALDDDLKPALAKLIEEAIVPAASAADALLIDGGTDSGMMALIGQAVEAESPKPLLVGV